MTNASFNYPLQKRTHAAPKNSRRTLLLIGGGVLFLVLFIGAGLWFGQPKASSSSGYLRTTVETMQDPPRQVLIQYLDDSRALADAGAQALQASEVNALYAQMSQAYTAQATAAQFQQALDAMTQTYGQLVSVEYRNQSLEYFDDKSSLLDLEQAQSKIWYAAQTTTIQRPGFFLMITTHRVGTHYAILGLNYMDYGQNIPTWLTQVDAPVGQP